MKLHEGRDAVNHSLSTFLRLKNKYFFDFGLSNSSIEMCLVDFVFNK